MNLYRSSIRYAVTVAFFLSAGCGLVPEPPRQTAAAPAPASESAATAQINEINKSLSITAAQTQSSARDYRMGPEDLLQLTIYNVPEQDGRTIPRTMVMRVSQEGLIDVPMIGELQVKGKTPGELERALKERYAKYIRNPQVAVMVTEFHQRVAVMGAVQKPGVFELTGPKTVIDMLALAGGVTERAGNQVHVYRQDEKGDRQNYVVDLMVLANASGDISAAKNEAFINLPLKAGDVINVPQSGMFFVDGAVGKPGSYPLGRHYTLTQALATAGGVNQELADYSSVAIMRRGSPTETQTISVDLDDVNAGKTPDPLVQPDDVIVVPLSGFKFFVKRFVGTMFYGISAGSFIK